MDEAELAARLRVLQQQHAMESLRKPQGSESLWTAVGVVKGFDLAIQLVETIRKKDTEDKDF